MRTWNAPPPSGAGPGAALLVAAVLALIPAVLTFLYLPSFVHPVSTLMVKDLATFTATTGAGCRSTTFAPVLIHSVIMSEDGQFCFHRGIDSANSTASSTMRWPASRRAAPRPSPCRR